MNVPYYSILDQQVTKIALDHGFFSAQGLNVSLQPTTAGPVQIQQLQNGQLQASALTMANVLSALSNGIDLKFLPLGTTITSDPQTTTMALLASSAGGIKSMKDLDGKTIAEASLGSAQEFATKAMLAANGVDVSKVKFVVLPYPDQVPALKNGTVAGIISVSPYLDQALAGGGLTALGYPAKFLPGGLWFVYFVSAKFATDHPDAVKAFVNAERVAAAYANKNPHEVQDLAAKEANSTPSYSLRLPTFLTTSWPISVLTDWVQLYNEFGPAKLAGLPSNLSSLVWQG